MIEKFDNSTHNIYNKHMKILLLIISLMQYMAGSNISNKTAHYITKESSQKLNESIPLLRNISNQLTFNNALHFCMVDFQNIKNIVCLTGVISKKRLNVQFSMIQDLNELNDFNQEIISSENVRYNFLNIVISLINQIFPSIPEQDIEISTESNFLMRWLNNNNQNYITISLMHTGRNIEVTFNCYLSEDTKTIVTQPNSNEKKEYNESESLLDKKPTINILFVNKNK